MDMVARDAARSATARSATARDASRPDTGGEATQYGQVVVAHVAQVTTWRPASGDSALLFVPGDTRLALDGAAPRRCHAGDVIAIPSGAQLHIAIAPGNGWVAVTAPRRYFSAALPGRTAEVLAASVATHALYRHVRGLAMLPPATLDKPQALLAASALRELLGAATAMRLAVLPAGARRADDLLERIVAHLDTQLCTPVCVATLCRTLGCSRSSLYRAAESAGGLVEVAMQRRLVAVHRVLCSPADHRSIGQIARAHGFTDPSQFSRRFRRTFGVSAGQVRATVVRGPADGALLDPVHAAVFALPAGSGEEAGQPPAGLRRCSG
ncbi:hypothetical protein ASE95_07680 [Sphingomonas sp. Leaf231]|uniref:helix-turn-helix transcriptional regulator n=1 Tax=Sphingomonas sp. Leaf231 TaxID=1736301 RepID=UPI0006F977B8|nr:helix-turn-helix transcriptional regulator [Sphingomonas sp. Leaf231]KQN92571.1 hypothetical protein ASE95_07680 [Sphingomonas sp. Leaf231]